MKILVVDDSNTIRNILTDILSPYGLCDTAKNGLEALWLFKKAWQQKNPYDLVCLDIVMPEMNGHEVLKLIRSFEVDNNIQGDKRAKIIMVSSQDDHRNKFDAFKEFCDDYVTKPIVPEKLLFKIRKCDLIA
ncbi:MAG TPA: response regulator [Desulfobacteria bacterium]|nr:response regulator [Desulfobacteria bacterium]